MSIEPVEPAPDAPRGDEYIVVADATHAVVGYFQTYPEAVKLAGIARKSGGSVTIFKATKY